MDEGEIRAQARHDDRMAVYRERDKLREQKMALITAVNTYMAATDPKTAEHSIGAERARAELIEIAVKQLDGP